MAGDGRITLSLLFFGDFPSLAYRCLESIWSRMESGRDFIRDFRIGLNQISPRTRQVTDWFSQNVVTHYRLPVILYDCPENACKYPLMRRMLTTEPVPPAEWVMWFDDDSYLDGQPSWWAELLQAATAGDMLGKLYTQGVVGQQWDWVSRQAWFNPNVGPPPPNRRHHKPAFRFCTGGWWLIRSRALLRYDWPTPELRHRGGDCLLGELCRHAGLQLVGFERGVHINADAKGNHSKSPRRGVDEHQLGHLANLEMPNHNFNCQRTILGGEFYE